MSPLLFVHGDAALLVEIGYRAASMLDAVIVDPHGAGHFGDWQEMQQARAD